MNEKQVQDAFTGTIFEGAPVISTYTRADALRDGERVDKTEWASKREIMGGFLPRNIATRSGKRQTRPSISRAGSGAR